jgi:hypothetical protein
MSLSTARRLLALVLGALAMVTTFAAAASATEFGNGNWNGILSASPPTGFPVSPAAFDLSSGPANFTLGVPVHNLTGTQQQVSLVLIIHHIITFNGTNISDGQPGQPGISFPNGTAGMTTQTEYSRVPGTFTIGPNASTTFNFPATIADCGYYQLDVKNAAAGSNGVPALAVGFTRALGCGPYGNGQRLTPGFWKNHQAATTALLPQTLGSYQVSTFSQVTSIFNAMKCNQPANCLAAHLLAAKLDVSNGSSGCIAATLANADAFLTSIGWNGPGNYTLTSAQKNQALALESALDNYTNDSTSTTC